jgi:hypothetical protein
LKILATGSSTLAASKKFRDTLTGRKRTVHLVPVLWDELPAHRAATVAEPRRCPIPRPGSCAVWRPRRSVAGFRAPRRPCEP